MADPETHECYCPGCPEHNHNPWTPDDVGLQEAATWHNEHYHAGEEVAYVRGVDE